MSRQQPRRTASGLPDPNKYSSRVIRCGVISEDIKLRLGLFIQDLVLCVKKDFKS